jgi:hypothetical protein
VHNHETTKNLISSIDNLDTLKLLSVEEAKETPLDLDH